MILKGFFRGPSWTKRSYSRRCNSPRPPVSSADKGVAVAVLRGPSRPFADKRTLQSPLPFSAPPCPPRTKVLPLPFFVFLRGPSWTKRSCSRRCSSPRPSVSSADKGVAVAVHRVPSWPFVDKKKLQSPLQFSAALRAPPCPPRTKVLPLPFFVFLRGPCSRRCRSPRPSVSSADKGVAVAVLRVPSWPFVWTKRSYSRRCSSPRPSASSVAVARFSAPQSPLPFSAALRVLRGQRCCRCRSSCSFVALRGQKEVAVAVAVLRGPPCPPWTNVLPLPFFAVLRGPSWTKGSCSRRCRSPRPSVLRGQRCCRSSRSFAALRGQKEVAVAVAVLRGPPCPPWTNVLPAVLRGPSWIDQTMTLQISVQKTVNEP